MFKKILLATSAIILALTAALYVLGKGWFAELEHAGLPLAPKVPESAIEQRRLAQLSSKFEASQPAKQILFGDFHVHSTFSYDAFTMSLPIAQGDEGPHTPADACDYARYCSALDFWSINDHAEQISPRMWRETVDVVRECNARAGSDDNPDLVTFLGWEWTQTGPTADQHFGHKNVILKGLDEGEIPTRPIAAPGQGAPLPPAAARGLMALAAGDKRTRDMMPYLADIDATPLCPSATTVHEQPNDCKEVAHDPNELFAKLDQWAMEAIVIPHGTTWGIYSPPMTDWRKQLRDYHDPKRQALLEIFSGHGNSERWIDNQAWNVKPDGSRACPEETASYLPGCQQAGRIIQARCLEAGLSAELCQQRADEAKQNFVDAEMAGAATVPGVDMWTEWLDSAQCRDCFLPAFNYRRRGSAQYMLAMSDFSESDEPRRLKLGFIASSDNHSAKPGTGYKEFEFASTTDARFYLKTLAGLVKSNEEPVPQSKAVRWQDVPDTQLKEPERFNSFWYSGGLVAVHSEGRSRERIWEAVQRRETYGTSGPRILLWFDLLNAEKPVSMGGEVGLSYIPEFRVRAVGSRLQKPGCPASAELALGEQRLGQLCRNECYFPSDQRRLIDRIEIVRIRPQQFENEAIDPLIEDAWQVHHCDADQSGCEFTFSDPDFVKGQRDVVYYARVVETEKPTLNAANLGCEYNELGVCISMSDCGNDPGSPNDCLAGAEHRAWSSPIFVDYD